MNPPLRERLRSEHDRRITAIGELAAQRQQSGRLITVRDVMELFGMRSTNTAHVWLRRAVAEGLLVPFGGGPNRANGFRVRGRYACPCCGGSGVAADAAGVVTVREIEP